MMMMGMGSGGSSMGGSSMGSMSGGSSMSSMPMDPMMGMGSMGGGSMGQMAPMDPMMAQMGYGSMPMMQSPGMAGHAQAAMGNHSVVASNGLGFDFVSLLTGLFNFALGIFAILLIVGLIVGGVIFLKRYLFEGGANILAPRVSGSCTKCGQVLQAEWNCCPKCGEAKFIAQPKPIQA